MVEKGEAGTWHGADGIASNEFLLDDCLKSFGQGDSQGSATSSQGGKRKFSEVESHADNADEGTPTKKSRTPSVKGTDKGYVHLFCPGRQLFPNARAEMLKMTDVDMFETVDGIPNFIWDEFPYANLLLQHLLGGIPRECLVTPIDGHCPHPGCEWKEKERDRGVAHYRRHAATHYGPIGFYIICLLCPWATKRADDKEKHFQTCPGLLGADGVREKASPDLVQRTDKNVFLR
jgi:hypothetical protein